MRGELTVFKKVEELGNENIDYKSEVVSTEISQNLGEFDFLSLILEPAFRFVTKL